jgi:hypothetical protein
MEWLFGTVTPISIQSAVKDVDMTKTQRVEQFFGLTPYHAPADKTHRQSGRGL